MDEVRKRHRQPILQFGRQPEQDQDVMLRGSQGRPISLTGALPEPRDPCSLQAGY